MFKKFFKTEEDVCVVTDEQRQEVVDRLKLEMNRLDKRFENKGNDNVEK